MQEHATKKPIPEIPETDISNLKPMNRRGTYSGLFIGEYRLLTVAVKQLVYFRNELEEELQREAMIMLHLNHPNIVRFLGIFRGCNSGLVLEFVENGSLYDIYRSKGDAEWSLRLRLQIAKEIGMALHYLHHHRPPILHCELKSKHVLIDRDNQAKLSGLGLSKIKRGIIDPDLCPQTDSLAYLAPEMLMMLQAGESYDAAIDIFSYGLLIWGLLHSKEPAEKLRPQQVLMKRIMPNRDPGEVLEAEKTPRELAELLTQSWNRDPKSRPKTEQFVQVIDALLEKLPPITVQAQAPAMPVPEMAAREAELQSRLDKAEQEATQAKLEAQQAEQRAQREQVARISAEKALQTEQQDKASLQALIARREQEARTMAAREAAAREAERQAEAAREAERLAMSSDARVQAKANSVKEKTPRVVVAELLNAAARGRLDEVEACIRQNRDLVFAQGDVIDLTGRAFRNITAFQYAVWALDKEMWQLLLTALPLANAYDQLHALEHERQDIIQTHGAHYSFDPLMNAYQTYLANWRTWCQKSNWDALDNAWVKGVGGAQRMMPAWFAYLFSERGQDTAWTTGNFNKTYVRTGIGAWDEKLVCNVWALINATADSGTRTNAHKDRVRPLTPQQRKQWAQEMGTSASPGNAPPPLQCPAGASERLANLKSLRERDLAELTDQLSQAAPNQSASAPRARPKPM